MNGKLRTGLIILAGLIIITFLSSCKQFKKVEGEFLWKRHFIKANNYFQKKEYKKAALEYEKTLQYRPDLLEAHFFLGVCYQNLYRPSLDTEGSKQQAQWVVKKVAEEYNIEPDLIERLVKLNTETKLRAALTLLKLKWFEDPLKQGIDMSTDRSFKEEIKRIGKKLTLAQLVDKLKEDLNMWLEKIKAEPEPEEVKEEQPAEQEKKEEKKTEAKKGKKEVKGEKGKEEKAKEEQPQKEEKKEVTREDIAFAKSYITNRIYILAAINHFNYVLEKRPEDKNAIKALALLYSQIGDFENAEKFYLKLFNENPNDPKMYYILANFYDQFGKVDKAEEMYKKRIELDPKNPEGWLYLANFYSSQLNKITERTPENVRKAIEYMNKSIEAHMKRAEIIPDSEKDKKAEAYYNVGVACWAKSYRIPELDPADRLATLKTGLEALDKALQYKPEYPEAYVYKNLLYREFAKIYPNKKKYYDKLAEEELKKYRELKAKMEKKKKIEEALSGALKEE